MEKMKNMKLANANFKNYIFNKNRVYISKELFEQMSDSEFALYWGRWNQDAVKWLLKPLDVGEQVDSKMWKLIDQQISKMVK